MLASSTVCAGSASTAEDRKLPSIVAGISLTFAGAVSNFAAPALLGLPVGMHTLSTRLYGMISTGQVERGYDDSIYEYENDLSVRDRLEDVVTGASPGLRAQLERALAADDGRFRAATEAVERVG